MRDILDCGKLLVVNINVVQYVLKSKKNLAIDLRKKGSSYSEIKKVISIPKSTLSYWLRNVKLEKNQSEKLKNKRLETAKANSAKKIYETSVMIEEIKNSSSKDIKKISRRELWLMGIVLYWKERLLSGIESDLRRGVRFTSSDPGLVKLFLRWLKDAGKIEDDEIFFDIFIGTDKRSSIDEALEYWSKVTKFARPYFRHFYFQKIRPGMIKPSVTGKKQIKRKNYKKARFGYLRVRVKASSMLARQIYGWAKGVHSILLN